VAKVRLKATLTIGARNYLPDEEIELPDEEATTLFRRGLVEIVRESTAERKVTKKKGGK
jgi:hypothetical protein